MSDFGSRCIQMLACEYNLRYDDLRLAYLSLIHISEPTRPY